MLPWRQPGFENGSTDKTLPATSSTLQIRLCPRRQPGLVRAPLSGLGRCRLRELLQGQILEAFEVEFAGAQNGDLIDFDKALLRRQPQVGDVIVYRQLSGEVSHTGVVCRIDPIIQGGEAITVFVRSKWGVLEEVLHHERVCPSIYLNGTEIEYWRLSR